MKTHLSLLCPVLLMISLFLSFLTDAQERNSLVLGLGMGPGLTSFNQGNVTDAHVSFGAGFELGYGFARHLNIKASGSRLFPGHNDLKVSSYWLSLDYEI